MDWYKKANERAMKYRNLPFAPITPDRAFYTSGDFSKQIRTLEDVLVGIKGRKFFNKAIKKLQKMDSNAEDPKSYIKALHRLKKIGHGGDKDDFQQALASIQLAFMGTMYDPSGSSNMRAPMFDMNTNVMR